jgi:uncharacterized protein (TIGR03066 family)
MSILRLVFVGCLAIGLVGSASGRAPAPAKEPSNKEKLVGTWAPAKAPEGAPEATIEFTKDGKLTVTAKVGEKTITLEGTYKLDGDKLAVTMKGPDGKEKEETVTITKLTDEVLVTKDGKGKEEEFKKKKK